MRVLILAQHLAHALGGIEIQCDLIARGMIERGHEVVYGAVGTRPAPEAVPYATDRWLPGDAENLRSLVDTHRPDVIYFRNNKSGLLSAAVTARRARVPLVFAVSSLQDVQAWSYHRKQGRMTLRRCASVAWQRIKSRWNWRGFSAVSAAVSLNPDYTERLPVALREHIPDAMDPELESFDWPRPYVAWVAQLKDYKHPEEFVALASQCADMDLDFLMVGGLAHARYDWIAKMEGTPARFHYLGPMTPRQVNGFLAGAMMMIHTCDPEGFGNNFIQAWQQGRPTLSLRFDPAGLIRRLRLGTVPGSLAGLVADLRRLVADDAEREAMGTRALAHAVTYAPNATLDRLETLFNRVIQMTGKGMR